VSRLSSHRKRSPASAHIRLLGREFQKSCLTGRVRCASSGSVAIGERIPTVNTGVRVPRTNPVMERRVRSCRAELLDRTLIVNQAHLLHALREYETSYNQHRPPPSAPHRSTPTPLPQPITEPERLDHLDTRRRDRLDGILHEYRHTA
jgi:putative transposase